MQLPRRRARGVEEGEGWPHQHQEPWRRKRRGWLAWRRKRRGWLGCTGLFRFADGADAVLMAAGAAGAVASGVAQLLMTLIFGEVVNAFGSGSRHDILHRVSGVRLKSPSPFNCSSCVAIPSLEFGRD